uniref:Myb/SANT-like DNA-binding domain-containing protein n=1 Tax=Chelydra serpentina TaxID=8475 RepID=A0A8C3SMP6_CHESE
MPAFHSKRAPACTPELLYLLSLWREEAVQLQFRSSRRNFDTNKQIACGLDEKGHDRDTQQCHAKIEELRQVYQKAREANHRSGVASKTWCFYKELHAILGGDPHLHHQEPQGYFRETEAVASRVNPKDKVVDEEVKLEEDVGHTTGSLEVW